MRKLTTEQVIFLHHILIQYSGGSNGIRDEGLLDSALVAPFISFEGISNYKTIESKAARLAFGLIKNHPFVDGNKRIGILAMLSFLEINGIILTCTEEELIMLGVGVADGSIAEKTILDFIVEHD